jgi:hypothetical protein
MHSGREASCILKLTNFRNMHSENPKKMLMLSASTASRDAGADADASLLANRIRRRQNHLATMITRPVFVCQCRVLLYGALC